MKMLKSIAALSLMGLVSVAHAGFGSYRQDAGYGRDHDYGYGYDHDYGDDRGHRHGDRHRYTDWARVVRTTPQYERVRVPHRECSREYVSSEEPIYRRADGHSVGGAVIGGIAGGILGNQVGEGSGRTAATAVGAVVGAVVGDRIGSGGGYRSIDYGPREVERCRVVNHWEKRLTGYQVDYVYKGRRYSRFMTEEPGRRIPVRVSVAPR